MLVYGKRRVGKSTLLREAAKRFEGVVINHMCVTSTFEGNLELIYQSISEEEKAQLDSIKGITVSGVSFICTGGFAFEGKNDFELINGKALYFDK